MKRDFHEEYQNYIESDMPDLWSRIEPNLKNKKEMDTVTAAETDAGKQYEKVINENDGHKDREKRKRKTIYIMRASISVAACLCVLVIGMRAMQMHSKSMDNAAITEEMYEPEASACGETAAESPEEYAEEAEDYMFDSADDGVMAEERTEESMEEAVQWNGETETDSTEKTDTLNYDSDSQGEALEIQRATLTKISVASETMQEKGYVYIYTFRLEDNSTLLVYLTGEQCDSLEEQNISIERKAAYSLVVVPAGSQGEQEDPAVGECFLQKIEKLP